MSRLALAALALAMLAPPAVAHAGPPWMSIEYPANPHDPATRGALAVVHTYHHGAQIASSFEARAIGIVAGARRTVALQVAPTPRQGAYAVRGELPRGGTWVLVITRQNRDGGERATALVALDADREVLMVRIPHDRVESGRWLVPRDPRQAEIDAMLDEATAIVAMRAGTTNRAAARRTVLRRVAPPVS